jgi:hypothetical protein
MFALAVGAGVGGGDFRGRASPSVVVFSTKATSSLTFASLCSVPVALAVKALHHNAILNEEHTVMELSIMD